MKAPHTLRFALHWTAAAVCLPFLFAGAVNTGFSGFWMATPMAAALVLLARRSRKALAASAVLILACIAVSLTQDSNPWLHPVLGKTFVLQEDAAVLRCADLSANVPATFQVESLHDAEVLEHAPDCGLVQLLPRGQALYVSGVRRELDEFSTDIVLSVQQSLGPPLDGHNLVASWGLYGFEAPDLLQGYSGASAAWARNLGLLMAWPAVPLLLMAPPAPGLPPPPTASAPVAPAR